MGYGLKLPKYILDLPSFGCINIHVSLLPRWRGAAPAPGPRRRRRAEIVMLLGLARRTATNRESITILLVRKGLAALPGRVQPQRHQHGAVAQLRELGLIKPQELVLLGPDDRGVSAAKHGVCNTAPPL